MLLAALRKNPQSDFFGERTMGFSFSKDSPRPQTNAAGVIEMIPKNDFFRESARAGLLKDRRAS